MYEKEKYCCGECIYPKSVVPANDPHAQDMLVVVEIFKSFGARSRRKSRLNINFPETPDLEVTLYNTPADEWLILLRLIETPH